MNQTTPRVAIDVGGTFTEQYDLKNELVSEERAREIYQPS